MSELNCYDVQLMANTMALNAEVQGMVAENQKLLLENQPPKYLKVDFDETINRYGLDAGYLQNYIHKYR